MCRVQWGDHGGKKPRKGGEKRGGTEHGRALGHCHSKPQGGRRVGVAGSYDRNLTSSLGGG